MTTSAEYSVAVHEQKKFGRLATGILQALIVAAILGLAGDRITLGNQIRDIQLQLQVEVGKLRSDIAAMSAARTQIVEDYRLNMARLEAQVEAARRDIQQLLSAVATLMSEIKTLRK